MTYVQFTSILDRISIKVNWDYKVILSPHVQEEGFITGNDHPFVAVKKENIVRKDKMTLSDLQNLKRMAK